MALVRICGVSDDVTGRAAGQLCKLRSFEFAWAVVEGLPGVDDDLLVREYTRAWASWERQIGIRPKYTEDARNADILIGSRVIDGPAGVLAEAQLPCGNYPRQLLSWFDQSEAWIVVGGTPMRRGIPLFLTAAHEFGHHLGLPHSTVAGALMAPMLNTEIDGPQEDDINQGRARYGPAILLPPPTTPPPTTPFPTTPPPWIPTTPPPTIPMPPGGNMDLSKLIAILEGSLYIAGMLAKATATTADDQAVLFLSGLLAALKSIPVGPSGIVDKAVVAAVMEQHVEALKVA